MRPWDEVRDRRAVPALLYWRETRNHFTQEEIAEALGMHRVTYNKIEKGKAPLTYRYLKELAAFYGVDMAVMLGAVEAESGEIPEPTVARDAVRGWVYGELGRLAGAGADEQEIADVRVLLTSPVLTSFLDAMPDAEAIAALRGVSQAVIEPALRRRGKRI
jgi:transcriptional regulator with XRE-family HTH domain